MGIFKRTDDEIREEEKETFKLHAQGIITDKELGAKISRLDRERARPEDWKELLGEHLPSYLIACGLPIITAAMLSLGFRDCVINQDKAETSDVNENPTRVEEQVSPDTQLSTDDVVSIQDEGELVIHHGNGR